MDRTGTTGPSSACSGAWSGSPASTTCTSTLDQQPEPTDDPLPGAQIHVIGRLLRALLQLAAGDLLALHDLDCASRRTVRGRALDEDAESTAPRVHELYEALPPRRVTPGRPP